MCVYLWVCLIHMYIDTTSVIITSGYMLSYNQQPYSISVIICYTIVSLTETYIIISCIIVVSGGGGGSSSSSSRFGIIISISIAIVISRFISTYIYIYIYMYMYMHIFVYVRPMFQLRISKFVV